jgi:two-component system response regulator DevR
MDFDVQLVRPDEPLTWLRIAIVDDHLPVREGLRQLLDAEPELIVVGQAGSFVEACAVVPVCGAQVAILDTRLGDGCGIRLCRRLRSADPSLVCLLLTSFDDDDALLSAIVAGASGLVLRQVNGGAAIGAVRRAAAGAAFHTATVRDRALRRIHSRVVQDADTSADTDREERMVEAVVAGKTDRQIGIEMRIDEDSVHGYVSNLVTALGLRPARSVG